MAGVGAVEEKRTELSHESRGAPNLDVGTVGDGDVLAIGGELNVADLFLELKLAENNLLVDVDKQSMALLIDGDEGAAVGGKREAGDVAAVLHGKG